MRDSLDNAIAVVGLGCVLPDAMSPDELWRNTLAGHSALRPLGGPQWERCYDPDPRAADRSYCLLGARVERFQFDWRRFRMPPAEAERINPLQLMTLTAGAAALGGLKALPPERTGAVLGSMGLGWQRDSGLRIRLAELCDAAARAPRLRALPEAQRRAALAAAQEALCARLQPVSEDNVVNAAASVAAGRIAMHLDLRGLHYAVDAGFASSLAALDAGVRLLRDRTLDAVLVGGVSELLTPLELVAFAKLGGLARRRVLPFDEDAEGTLLGEGVALFALKRYEDALRDGEEIFALCRGVGGSSDGRRRALCVPWWEGQALAMRRAYQDAGLPPETVGFVECHATGTPVGDASEVRALRAVFEGAEAGVALGSAKPFVGHLRAASGAVGLLRAVLALRHGLVPAQLGFRAAAPALELERSPFVVPTRPTPLLPRAGAAVPRAAVSAFGFGGNNFHAVLEAPRAAPARVVVPVRPRSVTPASDEPIAIIGMGGCFPGARDVPSFWDLLLRGEDTTREVPKERWDIGRYFDPDPDRQETCYTRLGCFLDRLPEIEERWRIPPAAAPVIDPGQLLMLQVAEEALGDAGFDPARWDRGRVAVMLAFLPCQGKKFLADLRIHCGELLDVLGLSLREAGVEPAAVRAILDEAEAQMKAGLPPITEDTLGGYLGSINAARVASHFDLRGPHCVVDSACASAHAAVHAAVQALRHGTCDAAIAGGTWVDMMPEFYVAACRFHALSARGCRPFGAGTDGFVPGEGAGALVLRRLRDAERDGQRIHAVIRSVSGSSDGRGRSVLAPSPAGEALAMERALREAGVAPEEVDYVECHGTGTALGDAVEVEALLRAYGRGRRRPLLIGSVKSNIGHLNAAAGIPAIIKAALAVREGVIPASLKAEEPNPQIDFAAGPVRVVTAATPWPRPAGGPRRAGVSSFGVGGSNLHLVLEEYQPPAAAARVGGGAACANALDEDPLPVAAAGGGSLDECVAGIATLCAEAAGRGPREFLAALATSQRRADAPSAVRVAVVAGSAEELGRKLELLRAFARRGGSEALLRRQGVMVGRPATPPRAAVVFPGQGPQYANMLRLAAGRFPVLREALGEIDRAYEALCGRPLTPAFFVDNPKAFALRDEDAHCAVFAVSCALLRLFRRYGLAPAAVMGQSAGELAALVAAGALRLEDGLRAMRERTLAVLALDVGDPGRMVALTCGARAAAPLCEGLPGYAALAADNSPHACVVSAERAAIPVLLRRCADAGIEAAVLPVSHGYHSRLVAPAAPRYERALLGLAFRTPTCEVVSTVTGTPIGHLRPDALPAHLARQIVEPVHLTQAVEALYSGGARLFIECGPKWGLTTFIDQILGERPHVAQAAIHPKIGEVEQLHRALACLFAHGLAGLRPLAAAERPLPAPPAIEVNEMHEAEPTDDEALALLRSIHEQIGRLLARREEAAAAPHPGPLRPVSPDGAASVGEPAPVPQVEAPRPPGGSRDRAEEVRRAYLGRLKARTGYPEDMLELDLDLEADLGVDTVKQVAVIADVRTALGLAADPEFKLREHSTPRKAIAYLLSRLEAASSTAPPSSAATGAPPEVRAAAPSGPRTLAARTIVSGETGTHAPSGGQALVTEARCLQLLLSAVRRGRPGAWLSGLKDLRVGGPAFLPDGGGPLTLTITGEDCPEGLRCRVLSNDPGAPHLEATALFDEAPPPPPPLAPEARVVLDRRGRPDNGLALLTATRRGGGDPARRSVIWAWGSRFDEVVGGLRLPAPGEEPAEEGLSEILTSAFWLADFGWYGLSGAVHWLAGVRGARFYALPRPESELLLHVRLLPPEAGTWGADALCTDGALQVVAEIDGLRGRAAGQLAGALGIPGAAEEAAVDWQRFYRRMHGELGDGEDRTW